MRCPGHESQFSGAPREQIHHIVHCLQYNRCSGETQRGASITRHGVMPATLALTFFIFNILHTYFATYFTGVLKVPPFVIGQRGQPEGLS